MLFTKLFKPSGGGRTSTKNVLPDVILDEGRHPLTNTEKRRVPSKAGIVILYDPYENPVFVDCGTMDSVLTAAHDNHPHAVWFRLIQHYKDYPSMIQFVETLKTHRTDARR
jgi:hypothetical protein